VPPMPDADPVREDQPAQRVLLPAVPILTVRLACESQAC
jgi:hypothetical protein